jgi:acyl-CoA dehydrogenase
MDSIVAETAARIYSDLCDPPTVNRAADEGWKAPAWAALEEAGLTLAWVPESLGGAGAELPTASPCCARPAAARGAATRRDAACGLAAGRCRIASPKGAMACGPVREGDRVVLAMGGTVSGRLRAIPFARRRGTSLAVEREGGGAAVALLDAGAAGIAGGASIAAMLDTVRLDGIRPIAVSDAPAAAWREASLLVGATVRSMQMAGALRRSSTSRSPTPTSASPSGGRSPSSRPCSTTSRASPARSPPPSPRRDRRPMP